MTLLQRSPRGDCVARAWREKIAICIASGPSLTREQIETTRRARQQDRARVIAINDNYLVAPFADVHYYADIKWRLWHEAGLARAWPWCSFTAEEVKRAFAGFAGQRCTLTCTPAGPDEYQLRNSLPDGLSLDPHGIATGFNTGHQALNIAALSGAEQILLLGYDGAPTDGRKHAFGEHPDRSVVPYPFMLAEMKKAAQAIEQLGVRVINCSLQSAIDCFEKMPLDVALDCLQPDQAAAALSA